MVEITLTPHRGNSSRAFPYTGILGLTPVSVQGVVRIRLDEDRRPVQDAFSVVVRVRCYEADNAINASSSRAHLLYEVLERVWSPPDGQPKASLAELETPFRLVIPRDAPSHGALSMLSFKTFRVFWTVDAVIHHRPTSLYGSCIRKALPVFLVDHSMPRALPPVATWHASPGLPFDYTVTASTALLGPADPLSVDVRWRSGDEDAVSPVRKVVIELVRTIDRSDRPSTAAAAVTPPTLSPAHWRSNSARPSPMPTPMEPSPSSSDGSSRDSYFGALTSSDTSEGSSPELSRAGWKRDQAIVMTLSREGSELVANGERSWSTTLEGTVPAGRTAYHYSLGQTCATADLRVRAFLSGKIVLRNKSVIELAPIEIEIRPVSVVERRDAQLKIGKIIAIQAAEARRYGTASSERVPPTRRSASVPRPPSTSSGDLLRPDSHASSDGRSSRSISPAISRQPSGLTVEASSDEEEDGADRPPRRDIAGPPSFANFSLQSPPPKPGHIRRSSSGVGPKERSGRASPLPPTRTPVGSPPPPVRQMADETRRKSSSGLRFLGDALRLGSRHSVSH